MQAGGLLNLVVCQIYISWCLAKAVSSF